MEMKTKLILVGGGFLILAFAFFIFNGSFTGNVVTEVSIDSFIDCLNDKQVIMYGFTNHPSVDAQLRLFGAYVSNLTIIDCHIMPESCKGVIIFPSWRIENRIISSGLSLGVLSDLSGCKL